MFGKTLKNSLLKNAQDVQASILKSLSLTINSAPKRLAALIVPPAPLPGSLGDEAMLSALSSYLFSSNFKQIGIVTFDPQHQWGIQEYVTEVVDIAKRSNKFRLVDTLNSYTHLYCIGADILDGFYSSTAACERLRLVELAAKLGLDTTIVGFSFNDSPSQKVVEVFSNLPATVKFCCRDAISQQRFTQHTQRSSKLVADLAFLLQPISDSELVNKVADWIDTQKSNNRMVIGFNAKYLYTGELNQASNYDVVKIYVIALVQVFQQNPNISFLLIPHDVREPFSDVRLAKEIFAALPAEIQTHCLQVSLPCEAAEIKGICAHLDLVITGRMHLAIACLGQTVPVECITYQGKFEGLLSFFNIKNASISSERALLPGELAIFINKIILIQKQMHEQIKVSLPNVLKKAKNNFEL